MKTTCRNLLIIATLACTGNAFAQSNFQETVTAHRRDSSQALGRDFWFAPVMNNLDEPGKYYRLFISSPVTTTAYVELGGLTKAIAVTANEIGSFNVELGSVMNSSGVVENKAIHVWSNDADLSVYFMSYNPVGDIPTELLRSTESMRCIPSIGLGTDYVVAGYESFFDTSNGNSGNYYDYPSEFTITANHDSTVIEITPSCNLRNAPIFTENVGVIAYPQDQKFEVTLNLGQCIQFQAVKAQDEENYDVTGTIIHSNFPVAVVGGCMAANIPPDFPHPNYVCDMMPPVRTWGATYYTTNSVQPKGLPGHILSLYCLISSIPGQTFYRQDSLGNHTEAVLGPTYDHYYVEEEGANKFFSDQPFMLVQYMNSASYPDEINGSGDPTEVVVDSRENFTKSVFFQTASDIAGIGSSDTNYANITVNKKDKNVTLDGKSISQYPHYFIDDTFEIYVASNITDGAHIVGSDLGCGVNVYGYGELQSYASAGSRGVWTNWPSDTISPTISFSQESTCLHAVVADPGSGIAEIILDSTTNMSFTVDNAFIPGSANTSSFADFCVSDSTLVGYLQFTAYDLAGNHSISTIDFSPSARPGFTVQSTPGFDTVLVGTSKTLGVFTVTDTSQTFPITIDSLWTDNSAFSLSSNSLPVTLNPGGLHTFSVTFSPLADTSYSANAYAHSAGLAARSASLTGTGYSINAGVTGSQTKVYATLTPNPAAKSVSLDFSLSQTANVSFELSSMDGKNVFNWKSDEQNAGQHIETLDISSIAQGDYIYRFSANGEVTSGKLAIVR